MKNTLATPSHRYSYIKLKTYGLRFIVCNFYETENITSYELRMTDSESRDPVVLKTAIRSRRQKKKKTVF